MALDDGVSATPGTRTACDRFEAASATAAARLGAVGAELAALRSTWRGRAAPKFGKAMDEWERQAEIVVAELDHMVAVLGRGSTGPVVTSDPCGVSSC
ncbi:WXG100 family type VII secretion target [Amycolatopsis minnesotensis]|uniref:WXG100 family type VII secretion target n=1 Tax=Amycolatopsis minnesotensis TaxID=337894 RepID=A0ABN2SKF9_9PSEU